MRNLVILAVLVVATMSQVFAQTSAQLNLADREVSKAEVAVKKAEKNFSSEKAKQLAELKRDLRRQEIIGERADTKDGIAAAAAKIKSLKAQIDSVSALTADKKMYESQQVLKSAESQRDSLKKAFLALKPVDKKNETKKVSAESDPVALNIKKKSAKTDNSSDEEAVAKPAKEPKEKTDIYDRRIPTEVNRVDYNQRERSYTLRREDLVLSQIEKNISSAISPGASEGGYKVIFDNMYIEPVNFMLTAANGSARKAVMVDPGVRQTKYLLPGKYLVTFYVDGRPSGQPRNLVIDGQTCDYKGEACFGFVYMPRF